MSANRNPQLMSPLSVSSGKYVLTGYWVHTPAGCRCPRAPGSACLLAVHTLLPFGAVMPVCVVVCCRGYAITASGSDDGGVVVSIHNATGLISGGAVGFLLRSPIALSSAVATDGVVARQPLIVASTCSPRHPVDVYVAVVDGNRRSLGLYHSILPFTVSSYDVMWMRTPMYGHCYCELGPCLWLR